MKYFLIPIVALGLSLSMVFGVEYDCVGPEAFPQYYGSPFVFMQESLGSSMEYYYSISGILLNVLVWSIVLFGIDKALAKLLKKKVVQVMYRLIVVVLVLFTFLTVWLRFGLMGRGFEEDSNYWYWNVEKEAKVWGMECEGQWKFGLF